MVSVGGLEQNQMKGSEPVTPHALVPRPPRPQASNTSLFNLAAVLRLRCQRKVQQQRQRIQTANLQR